MSGWAVQGPTRVSGRVGTGIWGLQAPFPTPVTGLNVLSAIYHFVYFPSHFLVVHFSSEMFFMA